MADIEASQLDAYDRKQALMQLIREKGIWGLPSYRKLGEMFGVTKQQIYLDIKSITSHFDQEELDKVFTEFYSADQTAMSEIHKILRINEGEEDAPDIKLKAIQTLVKLQKGCSDLLESFAKKNKAVERVQVEAVHYHITIEEPKSCNAMNEKELPSDTNQDHSEHQKNTKELHFNFKTKDLNNSVSN